MKLIFEDSAFGRDQHTFLFSQIIHFPISSRGYKINASHYKTIDDWLDHARKLCLAMQMKVAYSFPDTKNGPTQTTIKFYFLNYKDLSCFMAATYGDTQGKFSRSFRAASTQEALQWADKLRKFIEQHEMDAAVSVLKGIFVRTSTCSRLTDLALCAVMNTPLERKDPPFAQQLLLLEQKPK